MAEGKERKPAEAQAASTSARETAVAPFAKAHNDYFNAVHELHKSAHGKACDVYKAYAKSVRQAMEDCDYKGLQSAVEQFRSAWVELASPAVLAEGVSRAFEGYQHEVKAAFASSAGALDPASLALVAQSMAAITSHRMTYRGV